MIRFFSPINLLLLVAGAVAIIVGFIIVPAGVLLPVHWNIAGEPDGFLPRELALLMPAAILAGVWLLFFALGRLTKPENREAGAHVLSVAPMAITALFLAIAVATVAIGAGLPVSMVHVVTAAVGLLLIVLGNAMPKSRPNSLAGLRIPTTLRSPANWQATHRLTGVLTLAAGVVLLGAVFLLPPPALIWAVVGCVLVPFVVGSVYSIMLARRAV